MITRFRSIFALMTLSLFCISSGYSETPAAQEKPQEILTDMNLLSEAFGHAVGTNLNSMGINWDSESLLKGVANAFKGKEAPMDETACIQALSAIQDETYRKEAEKNLANAEAFMKEEAKKEGMIQVEKDKDLPLIQYQVIKQGQGKPVEEHSSPLILYRGTLSDGEVFNESKEEQRFPLDEMIKGFQQGLIGALEGEKRRVLIHPSKAYGAESSSPLPPNSVLVFEIEVVKSDTPAKEETDSKTVSTQEKDPNEIATSDDKMDPKTEVR